MACSLCSNAKSEALQLKAENERLKRENLELRARLGEDVDEDVTTPRECTSGQLECHGTLYQSSMHGTGIAGNFWLAS